MTLHDIVWSRPVGAYLIVLSVIVLTSWVPLWLGYEGETLYGITVFVSILSAPLWLLVPLSATSILWMVCFGAKERLVEFEYEWTVLIGAVLLNALTYFTPEYMELYRVVASHMTDSYSSVALLMVIVFTVSQRVQMYMEKQS